MLLRRLDYSAGALRLSCPQTDQKPVLSELVQLSVNNKNSPPGAVPFARPGQAEKRKHILPGNYSLQSPPVRLMFDAPPEASMRYHCVPEYDLLHSILFLRVEPVSLASLKGHVCCCLKCYKLKTPRLYAGKFLALGEKQEHVSLTRVIFSRPCPGPLSQ